VRKFKGQVLIDLREFFDKNGETLPTKKGISLTPENWDKIKKNISAIDQAIKNSK
jgi:hypothetical protein